jgi:hypothetical protein
MGYRRPYESSSLEITMGGDRGTRRRGRLSDSFFFRLLGILRGSGPLLTKAACERGRERGREGTVSAAG